MFKGLKQAKKIKELNRNQLKKEKEEVKENSAYIKDSNKYKTCHQCKNHRMYTTHDYCLSKEIRINNTISEAFRCTVFNKIETKDSKLGYY